MVHGHWPAYNNEQGVRHLSFDRDLPPMAWNCLISKLPNFKQKQQKKQILRHMPLLRHILPALNKTQILGVWRP